MCIARQSCHPSRWLLALNSLIWGNCEAATLTACQVGHTKRTGINAQCRSYSNESVDILLGYSFPMDSALHFLSLHLASPLYPSPPPTLTQYTNSPTSSDHMLFMMRSLMIWRHGCNHLDSNWSFCHKAWICPQTHLWLQCMYTVRRESICLKLTSQWRYTLANPPTVASTS